MCVKGDPMNHYRMEFSRCFLLLTIGLTVTSFAQVKDQQTQVERKEPSKQDVSPPLKDIRPKSDSVDGIERVIRLRRINQNQVSGDANGQPSQAIQPAVVSNLFQQVQVTSSLKNDISPPLSTITPRRVEAGPFKRVIPLRRIRPSTEGRRPTGPTVNDSVSRPLAPTPVGADIDKSFDGIGIGQGNFRPAASPPDTNGVVGATQFVQWVNNSFAIFDKRSGNLVYGPADGYTLFTGFGGPCETSND